MQDVVILGTGNYDIINLLEQINEVKKRYNVVAFLEKDESLYGRSIYGIPICGGDELLQTEFKACSVINNVMATPQLHENIFKKLGLHSNEGKFPNIVHPSIQLKYIKIGMGNIIYENVILGTRVSIGNGNILYPNSALGHEAYIGDSNLIAINVTIGARTKVLNRNLFGNSSTLSLGLSVGNDNNIGVGAVVISNVNDGESLLGNPARDSVQVIKELIKNKKINKK